MKIFNNVLIDLQVVPGVSEDGFQANLNPCLTTDTLRQSTEYHFHAQRKFILAKFY